MRWVVGEGGSGSMATIKFWSQLEPKLHPQTPSKAGPFVSTAIVSTVINISQFTSGINLGFNGSNSYSISSGKNQEGPFGL